MVMPVGQLREHFAGLATCFPAVMDELVDQMPATRVSDNVIALEEGDPDFKRAGTFDRGFNIEAASAQVIDRFWPCAIGNDPGAYRPCYAGVGVRVGPARGMTSPFCRSNHAILLHRLWAG